MSNKKVKMKWYDNANVLITIIIVAILMSIICSNSFMTIDHDYFSVLYGVINHNSIYLLVLVYFVLLKFHFGKSFFDYLNVFLIFIYFIATIASLMTLVQSFSLNTFLSALENIVILIYVFHTLLRDTHIWNDYKLAESPFNEISNDSYFYVLVVLTLLILIVNLISTVVLRGLFISLFDAIYILLFGRYIYLYRKYLDSKKKSVRRKKTVKKGDDE